MIDSEVLMRKLFYLFAAVLALILSLAGCRSGSKSPAQNGRDGIVDKSVVDTAYKVYYLNEDQIHLEGVTAIFTSETPEELIGECMALLESEPSEDGLLRTIPDSVHVLDSVYDPVTKQVDLYFDSGYARIPRNTEILVRAAVVKTLTQFEGVIDYVQFFVDGQALTESDGRKMIMMQSDFVENTRADVKQLDQETIRLYFASSDGTKLVAEDVYVHYSSTYALEQVIVESLISGPISQNLNPTLSSDVKLYDDVSVSDGVCYVDFNQRFLDRINEQSFALNVYSVVNSLTELDYISSVQIMIDGEIVEGNDANISLAQPLERNEELIVKSQDTPPVVESSETGETDTDAPAQEETQTRETESGQADETAETQMED